MENILKTENIMIICFVATNLMCKMGNMKSAKGRGEKQSILSHHDLWLEDK